MSARCPSCAALQGAVGFARNDFGALRVRLIRRGDVDGLAERVKEAKENLAEATQNLAAHQADCEAAKNAGPRDWRIPAPYAPPVTKPKVRKSRPIDESAFADVLSKPVVIEGTNNRLPATGRCHSCERVVSGERRYCGPCLARRA